ncbi:SapC family protein [Rhodovulum sp. DZ06]|uniref:SapC family protein n=1 Tax=Rhodovulum sp. DZ06 TaxID=3425126 RepID=UPI003D328454
MTDAAPADGQTAPAPLKPLFYQNPEVLEATRHGSLGLKAHTSFGFAAKANAIPLNMAEFAQAGVWYPIVFSGRDSLAPVAVVGVRGGQNLFVEDSGAWTSPAYVPAYVRRYPFILTRPDMAKDQVLLCVDRASDRVAEGEGNMFFEETKPSETTNSALEYCLNFQRQAMATEQLTKLLQEHDLLVERQGTLELPGGTERLRLTDFKVVDEDRLNKLSDAAMLDLRKKGGLAAAYCQMMSMNNWQALAHMAGKRGKPLA